jgi:hypothetical protein
MSDFDRDGTQEFQFSNAPDFSQLMANKMSTGKPTEAKPAPGGFDPYKVMVKKKEADEGKPIDVSDAVKWPEKEVAALEDFCKKMGVIGFNCGKMSPLAALAMLKNMLGVSDGPLEERVPVGYEKLGAKNTFNPHYPYQQSFAQKSLLKG